MTSSAMTDHSRGLLFSLRMLSGLRSRNSTPSANGLWRTRSSRTRDFSPSTPMTPSFAVAPIVPPVKTTRTLLTLSTLHCHLEHAVLTEPVAQRALVGAAADVQRHPHAQWLEHAADIPL